MPYPSTAGSAETGNRMEAILEFSSRHATRWLEEKKFPSQPLRKSKRSNLLVLQGIDHIIYPHNSLPSSHLTEEISHVTASLVSPRPTLAPCMFDAPGSNQIRVFSQLREKPRLWPSISGALFRSASRVMPEQIIRAPSVGL
ncbi:hypothetical protein MPTK1_6g04040 [Marchantia polymorpha subsp. ruderalis]|uniref:Uncharacterized protein n=2 Tax=Marchantia polymorpha TaxID=3197 RepID=A0AAF6BNC1_MARPO|nr:hypothetical protein MARPO_0034s0114 [Marchantia polymorpha]BBN13505.1 hypothetical protein Mp_6g04040 [Marchantia polymorpha subsp. ruderalis]|eukprot:PTQ41535.1 hypothetical protein MARPO_0034s0114 [Marchantia polymorpha]